MVLFIVSKILEIVAIVVIAITIIKLIYRKKFKLYPLQFIFLYFKN